MFFVAPNGNTLKRNEKHRKNNNVVMHREVCTFGGMPVGSSVIMVVFPGQLQRKNALQCSLSNDETDAEWTVCQTRLVQNEIFQAGYSIRLKKGFSTIPKNNNDNYNTPIWIVQVQNQVIFTIHVSQSSIMMVRCSRLY